MLTDWQPLTNSKSLHLRAQLLRKIRDFFDSRGLLEVETPVLSQATGTDPQLDYFSTSFHRLPEQQTLYLQTSPEFAMKRLLAAGSGSIYQICKAFRNGEAGRYHNPEFTLLEWYRVGFDLSQLMDEVEALIAVLFVNYGLDSTQRKSYTDVFYQYTGLNAQQFCYEDYCAYAMNCNLPEAIKLCGHEHGLWLDLLFSHRVQPMLAKNCLTMIADYPACQSSLARLDNENPLLTKRVELFINGVELGNGYHELTDYQQQNQRFDQELAIRQQRGLLVTHKDQRFLSALKSGLPDCSGIAIGLDRLLMLLSRSSHIDEVLSFPIARA